MRWEANLEVVIDVRELPRADEQHKLLLNPLKLEEWVSGICREVEAPSRLILDQWMGHETVTALVWVVKYEPTADCPVRRMALAPHIYIPVAFIAGWLKLVVGTVLVGNNSGIMPAFVQAPGEVFEVIQGLSSREGTTIIMAVSATLKWRIATFWFPTFVAIHSALLH
jgi:hypothetical protein